MNTTTIHVASRAGEYPVHIGSDLLPQVGASLRNSRAFIVTSDGIARDWLQPLLSGFTEQPVVLRVPAGEQHKRLATLERLAEQLAEHRADRASVLVALGGGVLGDLTGFLAAIYMRGIRWVGVPTTVLAQVDSSLGGKTGANLAAGKNLIGAFHPPAAVYSDIATLRTLPANEFRAGMQEAVKAGIIRDPALFAYIEANADRLLACDEDACQHVIAASVRVKADVVAADEHETGERMLLNLGHTLGHAIEAATGYTQLLHGEAVAWGMLAATFIALQRRMVTAEESVRIDAIIRRFGPLHRFQAGVEELVALTARDKKNRAGTRRFILPRGIGDAVVVEDVTDAELRRATQHIQELPL